jgi:hypothetical protein
MIIIFWLSSASELKIEIFQNSSAEYLHTLGFICLKNIERESCILQDEDIEIDLGCSRQQIN